MVSPTRPPGHSVILPSHLPASPFVSPAPPPLAIDTLARKTLSYLFSGGVLEKAPEVAELDEARERCRNGNPFPLIALQWPNFIITNPAEAIYFEGKIGDKVDPCLRLDNWQRDILRSFFDTSIKEVFIKGCVGAGKGTSSSLIANLAFDVWKGCRVILTSATQRHAVETIFAEVAMWRRQMTRPTSGRLMTEGIFATGQHRIMVANPQTGEAFSGKHGEMIIFIFDEASGTRELLYDNAQNQFHKIVALSNPRTLYGWFKSGFSPCLDPDVTQTVQGPFGRRRCVTVSGKHCLNVREKRLESAVGPLGGIAIDGVEYKQSEPIPMDKFEKVRVLIPNQTDWNRYCGMLAHKDPREVAVKAHGKFPKEDPTSQLILGSWLDRHIKAWQEDLPIEAFGLDCGASLDGDFTSLAAGGWRGVADIREWQIPNTMETVGWTIKTIREQYKIDLTQKRHPIAVDTVGIGKGVGDRLAELGCWVLPFSGNAGAELNPRRYRNLRAQAYGELGRRLDPQETWAAEPWALPGRDQDILQRLAEELCAPQKIYDSDGFRFRITPKNKKSGMSDNVRTLQEILGRSPDTADSVSYLFHACLVLYRHSRWESAFRSELLVWPPKGGEPAMAEAAAVNEARTAEEVKAERDRMTPESRDLLDFFRKQDSGWQSRSDEW